MIPIPPGANEDLPKTAGFSLPLDILVAPGRAFLKIARTGEWIPALVVVLVTGAGTIALATPAFVHFTAAAKTGPPLSSTDIAFNLGFELFALPALIAMLIATTLTAMSRVKDPKAPLGRYFSLAINCWIPSAVGALLHSAVAALRQPEAYAGYKQWLTALPDNLGVFAAPGNDREFDFLVRFNVFDAWTFVLLGFGISLFAGMRFGSALTLAACLYFMYTLVFSQ